MKRPLQTLHLMQVKLLWTFWENVWKASGKDGDPQVWSKADMYSCLTFNLFQLASVAAFGVYYFIISKCFLMLLGFFCVNPKPFSHIGICLILNFRPKVMDTEERISRLCVQTHNTLLILSSWQYRSLLSSPFRPAAPETRLLPSFSCFLYVWLCQSLLSMCVYTYLYICKVKFMYSTSLSGTLV